MFLLSCVCYAFVCKGGTFFVDLLCFYCLVFVMPLCASVVFVTSWLSFMVSNCEFVTFPLVRILGLVLYLIVSIPDLCTLTYF